MKKSEVSKLTENVYRTKHYIVKQVLYAVISLEENNAVMSVDTYYKRTIVRDCQKALGSTSQASKKLC